VDLVLVHGRRVVPIEIKLGAAVGPRDVAGLRQCMSDLGLRRGLVVYGRDEARRLGGGIELVPWRAVASGELDLPL
jgi:predicted AAA+ superfamily ATPase